MNRNHLKGSRELIQTTLSYLPPKWRSRVERIDFLTGVDPLFVGLHDIKLTHDDRSYSNTMHTYWNVPHSPTTIVIPTKENLGIGWLLHEFGHVLHEQLKWEPEAIETSAYSKTDRWEAFAEFFFFMFYNPYKPIDPGQVNILKDLKTLNMLNNLTPIP